MANYEARLSVFQVHDGTALRNISASIIDVGGLPGTRDVIETTALGDTAKTYIAGLQDASITLSLLYDDTAVASSPSASGSEPVFGLIWDDTLVRAFDYGPEGSGGGAPKYSGSLFVTNFEITSRVGDRVTATVTAKVSGGVTVGTY